MYDINRQQIKVYGDPEIGAIQAYGKAILGQSQDCQCYTGVPGYSDRGVVAYGGVVLGRSRDCRCYTGVRGYSDKGVVGYRGAVRPGTIPGLLVLHRCARIL